MSQFAIRTENLKKSFGRTTALDGVTIDFSEGLLHGLIGSDGAGKTTLMRLLAGLLKPTAGDIVFYKDGVRSEFGEARPSLAYMPQQASLYPDLSVDEHLDFFKELYRLSPEDYRRRSAELLKITRLEKFRKRRAGRLGCAPAGKPGRPITWRCIPAGIGGLSPNRCSCWCPWMITWSIGAMRFLRRSSAWTAPCIIWVPI